MENYHKVWDQSVTASFLPRGGDSEGFLAHDWRRKASNGSLTENLDIWTVRLDGAPCAYLLHGLGRMDEMKSEG